MSRCPTCHKTFADLAKHWAASDCGKDMPVETAPAALSEVNDPLHLFECRFAHRVVADYNHLRFDKFIKASVCDAWHLLAVSWINELKSVAAEEAQKASSVAESVQAFGSVFDRGLQVLHKYQSEAARDRHNKTVLKAPYLEPKPFTVDASKAEFHKLATRFSLTELLGRVMQNDASARKQIIDASNEWKQGLKHMQRAKVYTDITDGWKARSSPMMRKATEAESNHVRMLIQLHNDDATYTNPIGTKKAFHKYSITSGAIANLPIRMRLDFAYMLLLSIVQAGLLKDNDGLAWSMAGVNRSGKEVVPDSLAAEFRNLERGVPMKIPNDDDPLGEPLEIVLVAYFVVVSADWLAAQACGFTPESTSANMPCGECEWISFAAQRRGVAAAAPRARTHALLQETATHLLKGNLSKTALAEKLKSAGINKLVCALQPNHFPGADSVLDTPPDVMHLFGCGLSRIEPCWMMRILFKEGAKLAVDDPWVKLNQNIETLNRTLPRGKRLPKLYPPRTGKKLKEMHLDLNASETFLFTMQSITLLEPLLTADGKGHPAWRSWLAHRAIVSKCLQHVITDEEGDELDQLIKRHEEAFDKVVDYKDLERPKNHFMTHLSAALRRFGPFRCFWCMPWEAFLQFIKRIINMSNFHSVSYSACTFWSMKQALVLSGHSSFVNKLSDQVEPSSEINYNLMAALQESALLATAAQQPDTVGCYAVRQVRSFTREPMEIRQGDWLLASKGGHTHVGVVGEIVELFLPGRSVLRMMLTTARQVEFEDDMRGSVITVERAQPSSDLYVCVESTSLHEVACDAGQSARLSFTYIY